MKLLLERVPPRKGGAEGAKRVLGTLDLPRNATVDDLKKEFAQLKSKYYAERQEWRLPLQDGQRRGEAIKGGKTLESYGLKDGSVVYFKDLGTQIGYSTVFFWEYFGPLVVYPLFFLFPSVFYGATPERSLTQKLACMYWSFHYVKRIFETFFVHRFSHGTMPVRNLFRNCSYYWGFAALVSYFINHPLYTAPDEKYLYPALGCALLCQLGNLYSHILLTNLRKPGETAYKIPRGFLFNFITCPNYTCEILGWFFFNVATQSLMGYMFMMAGAYQMALWAIAKHKRLRKTFDGKDGREKYPRRFIMLPPFF
mmetsp:Transcript_3273/g.8093  ORF Transcript_3273/g.8093 Transcript_3273/m.8093 type:complete len:311 (-) Transcript_3273:895-1827(-)